MADAGYNYEDVTGSTPPPSGTPATPSSMSYEEAMSAPPSHYNYGQAIQYGLVNSLPFGRDIGAAIETGESYLPQWMRAPGDVPKEQTGEPIAQRFAENKARINATNEAIGKEYPVTSTVTPLVGAALNPALPIAGPVRGMASGIASIAPRLSGLTADAIASGLVGGGYGALYGAGSGDSLSDRAARAETGAVLGSIGGASVPVIAGGLGRLGSAGLSLAKPFIRDPAAEAPDAVARAMMAERSAGASPAIGPFDYFRAQTAGQPVVTGDLGGASTRDLATWAANVSPEARGIMQKPLAERFQSQAPRFSDYISSLFGGNLDAQVARDRITAQARATNNPAYQRAYADGATGVWNPGASLTDKNGNTVPNLQELIKADPVKNAIAGASALAKNDAVLTGRPIVRNPFVLDAKGDWQLGTVYNPKNIATGTSLQLAGVGGNKAYPTLEFWDKVKQGLDDQAGAAYRAGNKYQGNQIVGLKNALLTNLDNEVPSYAIARQGASGFFGAENALEAGEKFLGMTKVADIDGMKKAFSQYTPAEQAQFARGLASQIAQKAENASERTNISNMFSSSATREKMDMALGPDTANDIDAYLKRENSMMMLKNAVEGGSDTSRKLVSILSHSDVGKMAKAAMASPTAGAAAGAYAGFHETPDWNAREMARNMAVGAAGGAFAGMFGKSVQGFNRELAVNIARKMVSDDPAEVQQAMRVVSRNPKLMDGLRRVEGSLSYLSGNRSQGQDQNP